MIFATVGTQLPFDRLVRALDAWAQSHPGCDVFIQMHDSSFIPAHCRFVHYTSPAEWEQRFHEARLIVSHAGMGTILKCLDRGKPLVIMPRRESLNEHRNDHQVATAAHFKGREGLCVVGDAAELAAAMDSPPVGAASPGAKVPEVRKQLIESIGRFVVGSPETPEDPETDSLAGET